jgi:hypothetical protein
VSTLLLFDCLRAAVVILEDANGRVPEGVAEDLNSAAVLVEEAMVGLDVIEPAPESREPWPPG